MGKIVKLNNNPRYYSLKECSEYSCTCSEFIEHLSQYDQDSKLIISNDNGYTFSIINFEYRDYYKIDKNVFILKNQREYYNAKNCAEASLTLSEFVDYIHETGMENFKIVISNDDGYTYSAIRL